MPRAATTVADDGTRDGEGRVRDENLTAEAGVETEGPCVRHSTCQRRVNDEDVVFVREGLTRWAGGQPWSLYAVCDGHGGAMAANYVMGHLWRVLGPLLPATGLPHRQAPAFDHFASQVRTALATAFVKIGQQFAVDVSADKSGASVTLALLCGRLLTVANVGDADAVLDTGMEKILATVSDRIDANDAERVRLADAGVLVCRMSETQKGPAAVGEEGQGPLRCWPGGLQVARSIGDTKSSSRVFSCPHIFQVCVPDSGTRLIMGSAGLWSSLHWEEAAQVTRRTPVAGAARRLVGAAVSQQHGACAEDVSAIVLDLLPPGGGNFPRLVRERLRASGSVRRGAWWQLSACLRRCLRSGGGGEPRLGGEVLRTVAMIDGWELMRDALGHNAPEVASVLLPVAEDASPHHPALRFPSARRASPVPGEGRQRLDQVDDGTSGQGEMELVAVRGDRRPCEIGYLGRGMVRGGGEDNVGSARRVSIRCSTPNAAVTGPSGRRSSIEVWSPRSWQSDSSASKQAEPVHGPLQAGEAAPIKMAASAENESKDEEERGPRVGKTSWEMPAEKIQAQKMSRAKKNWIDKEAPPHDAAKSALKRASIGRRSGLLPWGGAQRKGSLSTRPAIDLETVKKRMGAGEGVGVGPLMLALEDRPGGQPCWYFAQSEDLEPLHTGWDGSEEEVSLSSWAFGPKQSCMID